MWRAGARLFIRELRQLAPHLRRRADTQHGSGVAGDGWSQLSGGCDRRRADGRPGVGVFGPAAATSPDERHHRPHAISHTMMLLDAVSVGTLPRRAVGGHGAARRSPG